MELCLVSFSSLSDTFTLLKSLFVFPHHVLVMVWILYYLGRHPEVQEKVYREIVSVLGDGEVTFDAVKDLK